MGKLKVAAVSLAVVLAGCSGSGSEEATVDDLGPAFCRDLAAGMAPQQIVGSSIKDGTYSPQEAADQVFVWATQDCPDELKGNELLRAYLDNWGIDPDA